MQIVKRTLPLSSSVLILAAAICHIAGTVMVFMDHDGKQRIRPTAAMTHLLNHTAALADVCPSPLYEIAFIDVVLFLASPVIVGGTIFAIPKFRKRALSYALRFRMRGELERKKPDLLDVVVNPAVASKANAGVVTPEAKGSPVSSPRPNPNYAAAKP